ncbi:colicin uptake protein TolQ [Pseudobythopirellula maris]|uniref:Colicin uptake protein TolQ n=1 Tax=Pseudobythopirellula maris TaxID=2527991 RepID=A0A5C5ZSQ3_9BACT|nr:MotA/TolQ/ExbB proton channel family protein [Pseudobythopirellula maris]TWT90017.1 colicin uptake protein TolQ [Pseudobythopirellula maris]
MQFETLFTLVGYIIYTVMAIVALWGAFCVILVWRRVSTTRFRNEQEQDAFMNELEPLLRTRAYENASALCDDDSRALPQLAMFAIENRDMGPQRVERQLVERFQLDVLSDIEHRLSWVSTVIKSAPMIGLLGTVIGMMGAFANLSTGSKVDTGKMAEDIMFALITTALGLMVAVPLLLCREGIALQIRKMEDLVATGMTRLMEMLR